MPSIVTRRQQSLAALADRAFDVLIIGGGITGAGVARDAALRGLSVALVDKGDFASGTSSKSSKLIHGGLRYLEQGHVRLVWESVNERSRLMRLAPHLVRPLEFLVPSYREDQPGLFVMDCGLWIYDALSGFSSPKMHHTHRRQRVLELEPTLRSDGLRGGIVYYDCATDDARLTLENILDAQALGAVTVNYVRAIRLLKESDRFVGAELEEGSVRFSVRAKVVINATGPWCDEVRHLYGAAPILSPTKGVHIVVDAKRFPLGRALLVKEKKRVVFFIPWGERSVIGTTDTFYESAPDAAYADRSDVEYLLRVGNSYFPEAKLDLDDVLATWTGLRPLIRPPSGVGASSTSREHHLESAPGLITIAGGKLTTYRCMAREVVDAAAVQLGCHTPCATEDRALPGGVNVEGQSGLDHITRSLHNDGLSESLARHTANTYGARAATIARRIHSDVNLATKLDEELPFVLAEIDNAVEDELARTLTDVLGRRVPLLLRSRDQGLAAAPRVASRMATLLKWNEVQREAAIAEYKSTVTATRRHRE